MFRPIPAFAIAALAFLSSFQAKAEDLKNALPALKRGGFVLVFRHGATEEKQRDIYPFRFDDMTAQRQLSEAGRATARGIGEALKLLAIPIGSVFTSKLRRGVETGELITGKDIVARDDLTDSGAGRSSAMFGRSGGGDADLGRALREQVNTPPPPGTNTLFVTHKTNIADAFGAELGDIREGEAAVFKPSTQRSLPTLVVRVQAQDWREAMQ